MPQNDPSIVEPVLVSIGVVFQLVGAYITYRGFRQGWHETKSETDRFIAPVIHFFDRIGLWISRCIRKILRRPSATIIHVGGVDIAATAGRVRLAKGWPPIAADVADRDAIDELNNRINAVQGDVDRHGVRQSEQGETLDEFVKEWGERVRQEAEEERIRQLGGLRKEAFGFLILTVGSLIQGVGSYFG